MKHKWKDVLQLGVQIVSKYVQFDFT